jgi:hypothetical protein
MTLSVTEKNGSSRLLDVTKIEEKVEKACKEYETLCSPNAIIDDAIATLYDGA